MRHNPFAERPFVAILPVVLVGIVAANIFDLPLWAWAVGCGAAALTAWLWMRAATVGIALALFAATIASWRAPVASELPHNQTVTLNITIIDNPSVGERHTRATGIVHGYVAGGEWVETDEQVMLYLAPDCDMSVGQNCVVRARVGEISGSGRWAQYGDFMRRRGYRSTVRVSEIRSMNGESWSVGIVAAKMQRWAAQHIERLQLNPDERAIIEAISIGQRGEISGDLRQSYSLSGASHLLAVSGLHVGIVAMLVNGLLMLLGMVRRGHIWRNILAIAAIWAYAMLTGASPSVLRAAMMFSGAQIAFASSTRYNGINILLATASVMLLLNPNYLYDISFQLSFAAVVGIFALYRPLFGLVRMRWKLLNIIWATIIIGVSATVATAPLVSYYFGRISLIGIVLNPIVIATAHVIILAAIVWILAPVGIANPLFSNVLQWTTWFQNSVVDATAQQAWGVWNVRFNGWQTAAVYAVFVLIYVIIARFFGKRNDSQRYTVARNRRSKGTH